MSVANINDFGEIYSAYAAGCLDPAFALMLETQAALRPDVSRAIARAETIAGIFLENENAVELSENAVQTALAMIEEIEAPKRSCRAAQIAGEGLEEILALPEPVREHALQACGERGWQRLGEGVARLKLDLESKADVELYRIGAGRTVPRHSHEGGEFTLVVSGGFSDDTGQFGPGDLSFKGPEHTHQPTGDLDGTCYALAIREGGLRFTGAMGLLQKLLGQ
ncbi:MAG: ChrR family anti-sigma-E factor [Pseudomonadota bacterium]